MDPRGRWRAPELGTPREVGPLRVFEAGSGPPVVLLHGLLVNANLWRKVVPLLAPKFHCVTLDLPLGSHELPMPAGADLSPPAIANLVADTIADLGLDDVTLVGNDTGGALSQILVGRRPQHIGRLVLTSCDYRDTFPPVMFSYFKPAARLPGAIKGLLLPMRLRLPRRLPIALGWLAKRPIDRPAEDSYLYPAMSSREIEEDLRQVIREIHPRHTREAADRLRGFDRPALIAWSREDKFFKPEFAEGLTRDLPNARLEWIDDARTFSMEDNPTRLAELIADFAREPG